MNGFRADSGIFTVTGADGIRIGVIGREANTVDYSKTDEARRDEKALLGSRTGIPEEHIIMLEQVHQDHIVIIDNPPKENRLAHAPADGMITNIPGICLVIRTADCVPVYAYDPVRKILGAAHSGWKGCHLEIARKLIDMMAEQFHCTRGDIEVFILPSIGPHSYIVGEDVASLFPDSVVERREQLYLDLWRSVEESLLRGGIRDEHIYTTGICTLQKSADFYSYRNGDSGRNLNFAFMLPRRAGGGVSGFSLKE